MDPQKIKQRIEEKLTGSTAEVDGDGHHFEAKVIADVFEGKNPVQRQRLVMSTLQDWFDSGELHALSIKTSTNKE